MTELQPKLRDGIRFLPAGLDRDAGYRVEDTANHRFYEIGYAEYAVLSLFDGQTTVAESMSLAARAFRDDALSLAETTALIRWAASADLLQAGPKPEKAPSAWAVFGAVNPLWMKVPLPSPERVLDLVSPALGWTQSKAIIAPAMLLFIAALFAGLAHANDISRSFSGILAVSNWIPLAIVWTLLKLWHEIGHALACRRHGVEVRNCGIIFILFAPCPYVDATSSWSLRSRWSRIHIAAAGMIAELTVAAIVVVAWPLFASGLGLGLDPDWTRQLAANALFSATVATLLFNANPLMKFDGYYILSDFMDAANLASRGSTAASGRCARVVFGQKQRNREPLWIEIYGWSAAVWRVIVTISLTAAASVLLPGIGLWIGLLGAFVSFAPPAIAAIGGAITRIQHGQSAGRALIVCSAASALLAATMTAPWPFSQTVPGVVVAPEDAVIRAASSGFVETLPVSLGEHVVANQTVLQLTDDESATQRRELDAKIARSLVRQRMLEADHELADAQQEADERVGLRRQRALLDERIEKCSIEATSDGTIVSQNRLNDLAGTYLSEGTEVAILQSSSPVEIEAAVQDRLIDLVRGRESESVTVVLPSGASLNAIVERVSPSATTSPVDDSLCTVAGGPIPATRNPADESIRTLRPHFPISLRVSGESSSRVTQLRIGMRVAVRLDSNRSTGSHLWMTTSDWWSELVRREQSTR